MAATLTPDNVSALPTDDQIAKAVDRSPELEFVTAAELRELFESDRWTLTERGAS